MEERRLCGYVREWWLPPKKNWIKEDFRRTEKYFYRKILINTWINLFGFIDYDKICFLRNIFNPHN